MNGTLGHIGVLLALVFALGSLGQLAYGVIAHKPRSCRRARWYVLGVCAGAIVATIAMEHALITHDFSLAFVAANNSRETPLLYDITGLWSALQGSILLWSLVLSGFVLVMVVRFRARIDEAVVSVGLIVALVVAVFFFALMLGPADPFAKSALPIPLDGQGPNPLLQDNALIAFHPVFLYLGYVGFTVPFSFAIASLITGKVGEGWLSETRRFALVSWAFLSVGIVLGAWWSYQVLGWGGFWGWDPVENAAFLPWLTATAYLHSVMIQERRGLLRIWNLSLLIATFALTILGTFLTRSGVIQSVHAFSDSGIGPALIGFFAAIVLIGVALIAWRGDRLASPGSIDSPLSREGAFLVNNLIFACFALVVLLGTVFPLLVQAIDGQSITVGKPYFNAFSVPIGIALLFFMAIAPALPWRKTTPQVLGRRLVVPAWTAALVLVVCVAAGLRGFTPLCAFFLGAFAAASAIRQLVLAGRAANLHGYRIWRGVVGRANGGMIVHVGVVVIATGLAASGSFSHSTELTLRPGQSVVFDHHRLTFLHWQGIDQPNEKGEKALVRVDGGGVFSPGLGSFNGSSEGTATPSVDSGIVDDVYLSLASAPVSPAQLTPVTLDVFVQPLVMWLWIGGALIAGGALLAAVPGNRRRPTDPASVPMPELLNDALVGARR
jgi:cytochrome c-type biogenesis protein CcmF